MCFKPNTVVKYYYSISMVPIITKIHIADNNIDKNELYNNHFNIDDTSILKKKKDAIILLICNFYLIISISNQLL